MTGFTTSLAPYETSCTVQLGNNRIKCSTANLHTQFQQDKDDEYVVAVCNANTALINIRKIVSIEDPQHCTCEAPFTINSPCTLYKCPVACAYQSQQVCSGGTLDHQVCLCNSSSNAACHFQPNCCVVGELSGCVLPSCNFHDLVPCAIQDNCHINCPTGCTTKFQHCCGYVQSNGVCVKANTVCNCEPFVRCPLPCNATPVCFPSRCNEASNGFVQYSTDICQTSIVQVNTVASDFSAPTGSNTWVDVYVDSYTINNDYTAENTLYGNALAKGEWETIYFANNYQAEDMVVYLTAHRPVGTNVKVFVKIHNNADPDPFNSKDWTLLQELPFSQNVFTSTADGDFAELSFELGAFPNTRVTSTGVVATQASNAVVTGTNTNFTTDSPAGSLVRIYSPLFPNNYMISLVSSVTNSTQLTLSDAVVNTGVVGSGLKIATVGYPQQAFLNGLNQNVVRYYTAGGNHFDKYDSYKLKVVLLSNSSIIVPYLDDARAIGVSA